MTWSRFDDAARKHPKAVMAGNDAWGFWCAAIMYCNQYGTDGFVPDAALATEVLPVPITKAKALKLAEACCRARLGPDGAGLFVRDEQRGGFIVHDFLDWNPSKSEVDAKRKADRDRKRRPPEGGGNSGGPPLGIPDGKRADSDSRADARARVPPARPAQPSPNEEPSSSVQVVEFDGETVVPLDLVERARSAGVFVELAAKMPGARVEQLVRKAELFVAYWSIGGGAGKRRRHWMARLRQDLVEAHQQGKLPQLDDSLPTPSRPPPIIVRDYTPEPLPDIPAEVLAQISPARPLLRPVKSREQQIAELRATLGEDASAGRVEPEAGSG